MNDNYFSEYRSSAGREVEGADVSIIPPTHMDRLRAVGQLIVQKELKMDLTEYQEEHSAKEGKETMTISSTSMTDRFDQFAVITALNKITFHYW